MASFDLAGIAEIQRRVKRVRTQLRGRAAAGIAREFTRLTRKAYDTGRQVNGAPRPLGVAGNKLTLVRTGETRRGLRYASRRGKVSIRLAGASQYLLRYGILPTRELPPKWTRAASAVVRRVATQLAEGGR